MHVGMQHALTIYQVVLSRLSMHGRYPHGMIEKIGRCPIHLSIDSTCTEGRGRFLLEKGGLLEGFPVFLYAYPYYRLSFLGYESVATLYLDLLL